MLRCGLLNSCGIRGYQIVACSGSLLIMDLHSALIGIQQNDGLQLADEIK